MRAIIPVAGVGSRLRPHTYTIPKVLLNVAGKPIIGHILDKLIESGFTSATIIVGYLGDLVKDYVRKNYTIEVDFVEQEERHGLGHAIYLSRHTISREPVLIILGDTIFDVDLVSMCKSETSSIGVKEVDDPRRFGVAELQNGFIKNLVEKPDEPKSNLALIGLYYIKNPELMLDCLREIISNNQRTKGEFQLTDGLQLMITRGEKISVFKIDGWFDCGSPETLLSTNKHLLNQINQNEKIDGVVIVPPVFIASDAKISNSVIGPNTTIASGAIVNESIIKNSIVSEKAKVSNAMLEDSIIGTNAIISGGYKRINIGDSSELEYY